MYKAKDRHYKTEKPQQFFNHRERYDARQEADELIRLCFNEIDPWEFEQELFAELIYYYTKDRKFIKSNLLKELREKRMAEFANKRFLALSSKNTQKQMENYEK